MNLLVISRGRNKITKRRKLHIRIRPLLFCAIFNEFKSDLGVGVGRKCSCFCTLSYTEFMNLRLVHYALTVKYQMSHPSYNDAIFSFQKIPF